MNQFKFILIGYFSTIKPNLTCVSYGMLVYFDLSYCNLILPNEKLVLFIFLNLFCSIKIFVQHLCPHLKKKTENLTMVLLSRMCVFEV